MRKTLILLAAALASGCATARAAPSDEAAIPFVRSDGIQDFKPAGTDSVYILSQSGRWYLVRTLGPCPRLKTADALGFETSALDQLDRHGTILAEGQRCPVDSVKLAEAPPPATRR